MKNLKNILIIICCVTLFSSTVNATAISAWTNVDGVFYNDKGEVIKGALSKGIDVSHHQGEIDWAKVKQSDIEFAIIRCGYGDDLETQDDMYFAQNVKGCEENGIPYGIYIYSYATDTLMAQSEAEHVLRLIEETNANPTLPIYYDIEDDNTQGNLSASALGDIAQVFGSAMTSAGYRVGVYSKLTWWNSKLTDSRFEQWDKWVAQYNSSCEYGSPYNMWQYTESGSIDGISGNLDVNIMLSKNCSIVGHSYLLETVINQATMQQAGSAIYVCRECGSTKTETIQNIKSITLSETTYTYNGKANEPSVNVIDNGGLTVHPENYTVSYSNNKKPGQATVTITFKGKYSGTFSEYFEINPAKVKNIKVSNQKGNKIKVTWKKSVGISGYELKYSPNKKFTKKTTKTQNIKASKKKFTSKKLKSNKRYYVKIRAYKIVDGTKLYSAWSKRKSVKIKY